MKKKILSCLLVLNLLISVLPVSAIALSDQSEVVINTITDYITDNNRSFKSGYKGKAWGCFAFCNYVWSGVFGKDYYSGKNVFTSESTTGRSGDVYGFLKNNNAKAGDILWCHWGNNEITHNMIVLDYDSSGIWLSDGLSTGRLWHNNSKISYKDKNYEQFFGGHCQLTLYKINDMLWNKVTGQGGEGPSTLKIIPDTYPTGTLKQGSRYSLKGTVTSNYNITSVTGEIVDSNGNVVFSYTQRPNAKSFSILNSKLDANMKFNELSPGEYYLRYTAVDASGQDAGTKSWKSTAFRIAGEEKDPESTLKIIPEDYPTGTLKEGSRYSLRGSVTSNYNITSVKGEIIGSNGNVMFSYTQRPNAKSFSILNSKLDANMKFNELSPGEYYLKYAAMDEYGKEVDWRSKSFTVQGERKETQVTITFNPDGGSVGRQTKTVLAGNAAGALPTPVRDSYDFIHWATKDGMVVTPDTVIGQDMTVYAQWRPQPVEEKPDVEVTDPEPKPKAGDWGAWSEWGYIPASASETRQVETREIKVSSAYTEYRYGRYIDATGKHNCWCATYLGGLFKGPVSEQYSSWSRTRYSTSGTGWSCGNCKGNHRGVDHTGSDGRDWWAEYLLPNGHYYWEESRTVPAEYKTQYRYRDWISG